MYPCLLAEGSCCYKFVYEGYEHCRFSPQPIRVAISFSSPRLTRRGTAWRRNASTPTVLRNVQYVVLEALWKDEGLTAVELSQLLTTDKATLSGILDRMADADLLIKRHDPKDRRMLRLYPSERANSLKDTLIKERKQANEELLAGVTPEERLLSSVT